MTRDREITIRTLMAADGNQIVTHNGRRMTAAEALKDIWRNESEPVTVEDGGVVPSQRAIDALPQHHFDELTRTGAIEGLTGPVKPRVHIVEHRDNGVTTSRMSLNPETSKVEGERPFDWRHFGPGNTPYDPKSGR